MTLKPNDTQALVSRGAAYARAGAGPYAIEDFNRALNIDPALAVAYFNKGVVFVHHEYWSEAIRNFNDAIAIDPDYAEAFTRRGLAKLNSSRHNFKQACADFKKGLELGDEDAEKGIEEYCK